MSPLERDEDQAFSFASRIVRGISAETERRCAEAAARGGGYRLFRSEPRYKHDATGYRMIVDFQILEPGEGAPGSGVVFGPWPR